MQTGLSHHTHTYAHICMYVILTLFAHETFKNNFVVYEASNWESHVVYRDFVNLVTKVYNVW